MLGIVYRCSDLASNNSFMLDPNCVIAKDVKGYFLNSLYTSRVSCEDYPQNRNGKKCIFNFNQNY